MTPFLGTPDGKQELTHCFLLLTHLDLLLLLLIHPPIWFLIRCLELDQRSNLTSGVGWKDNPERKILLTQPKALLRVYGTDFSPRFSGSPNNPVMASGKHLSPQFNIAHYCKASQFLFLELSKQSQKGEESLFSPARWPLMILSTIPQKVWLRVGHGFCQGLSWLL